MNWYRKFAAPALFEPHRLNPDKVTREKRKFFNFIKAQNWSIECYHGTSSMAWEAARQAGYLVAPKVRGVEDNEGRHDEDADPQAGDPELQRGMKQIFLSGEPEYADWYARSTAAIDGSQAMRISLKIPMYAIAEVQAAIFGTKGFYNEFGLNHRITEVIESDWEDSLKAEFIKIEIKKKFKLGNIKADELTTYLALPVKWVTNAEVIDGEKENEWHNPENYNPFQALYQKDYQQHEMPKLFKDKIPDVPSFVDGELIEAK